MKNWSNCDPTLKVGDLVWQTYKKNELLYKIVGIERRFLNKDDVHYHHTVFPGCEIGDEYNPIVTIEAVANFSIHTDAKKKIRKEMRYMDASYLIKADPADIQAHIKRISDLLLDLFP